jgi:asparagine synthase (glutamine-hydrolysing)
MRANKIGFSGNVEIRCPFLDVNLVDMVMSIDPELKMCDNTRPDGVH